MNRISPTDPPDEPVNRVAEVMAKMEGKVDAALNLFSKANEESAKSLAQIRGDFALMLELYHANPQGNHREAVVRFAKKYGGDPEILLILLRPIIQKPHGLLAEKMVELFFGQKDFASYAAIVPLIIRDLEKPDDGLWIAP